MWTFSRSSKQVICIQNLNWSNVISKLKSIVESKKCKLKKRFEHLLLIRYRKKSYKGSGSTPILGLEKLFKESNRKWDESSSLRLSVLSARYVSTLLCRNWQSRTKSACKGNILLKVNCAHSSHAMRHFSIRSLDGNFSFSSIRSAWTHLTLAQTWNRRLWEFNRCLTHSIGGRRRSRSSCECECCHRSALFVHWRDDTTSEIAKGFNATDSYIARFGFSDLNAQASSLSGLESQA